MKHEPEFKPLQGNLAFFWVRVSCSPFHLRQETQGPSNIHIPEGKLHLWCWWKVGWNLQSMTRNQHSSWDDMGCMKLSSSGCTDINIHIDLRRVSQGISDDSSRKSSHLYCMLWNTGYLWSKWGGNGLHLCWFQLHRAILHSWVDIRVHLVLWQCSWGLCGVLSRKSRLLTYLIGNTILLCTKCREIKPHLTVSGMCHGISRVVAGTWGIFSSTAGMAIRNSTLFSEVRTPV